MVVVWKWCLPLVSVVVPEVRNVVLICDVVSGVGLYLLLNASVGTAGIWFMLLMVVIGCVVLALQNFW